MDLIYFYILAIVPFLIGGLLWIFDKEITWQEWVGNSIVCFLVAATFHAIAYQSQVGDIETRSGQVSQVIHYPYWLEKETYTTTDSKGHTTSHTIYIPHPEHWDAYDTLSQEIGLSQNVYNDLKNKFGGRIVTEYVYKSGFDGGDHNIYKTDNATHYLQPTNGTFHWVNKIKASPSTFSFPKVPATIKVYDYPENPSAFESGRLLGSASLIDLFELDRMNARLGPTKKVNVILIGFNAQDASIAEWQKAKWIGGKKNDLVICWGGSNSHPTWVQVFGWSDSEFCKRNIETILLDNGINTNNLNLIETEIQKNYKIKDWKMFDYITVKSPMWCIYTYLIVMVVGQISFWIWAEWYGEQNHIAESRTANNKPRYRNYPGYRNWN